MRYGMPYKGSKNGIANWIIDNLPSAECFIDAFGGGGAITHCALLSKKWKKVVYNELEPLVYNGFEKAMKGDYKTEKRWISREDFFELKDTDFYVASCFSFGNGLKNYCYSKEVEPWKKAVHYARVLGDCSLLEEFGIHSDGSRSDIKKNEEDYKKTYISWYMKKFFQNEDIEFEKLELQANIAKESERLRTYLIDALEDAQLKRKDVDVLLGTNGMSGHYFGKSQWEFPTREAYTKMMTIMPKLQPYDDVVGLYEFYESLERLQSLQSLQSLESLERLQRLQRLESLEILETFNLSYEQLGIPDDAIVYCDIPYKNTSNYKSEFDHEAFYQWALNQKCLVFISEYQMPREFHLVSSIEKRCTLSGASNNVKTVEKLYCNKPFQKHGQLSIFDLIG